MVYTNPPTPNQEQQVIIGAVVEAANALRTGMITVNSPAGTGKTFTCRQICERLRGSVPVQVVAPTHKAAGLLRTGGLRASTIHRFFHLCGAYTDDGDLVFGAKVTEKERELVEAARAKGERKSYEVVLVDEASMVSRDLYERFTFCSQDMLIVFMGDHYQIPPVNEANSPVFDSDAVGDRFELVQNMRTRDSVIRQLSTGFRRQIAGGPQVNVGRSSMGEFLEVFARSADAVAITYTNARKNYLNSLVRRHLFAGGKPVHYVLPDLFAGEKLVFSGYRSCFYDALLLDAHERRHFEMPGNRLFDERIEKAADISSYAYNIARPYVGDAFSDTSYHASQIITACQVDEVETWVPYFYCDHVTPEHDKIPACKECGLRGKRALGVHVPMYRLVDESGTVWMYPVNSTSRKTVRDALTRYKSFCKTARSKLHWRSYYLVERMLLPDLCYTYASTVHKAQGSQWQDVFVDIDNIRRARDGPRLAYTAVTRAQETVRFI